MRLAVQPRVIMSKVSEHNSAGAVNTKGIPRPIEATIGFVGLLICSPVLLLMIVLTRLTSRGPAIFHQVRVGQGGRPFTLYKLRTMRTSGDGPQVTARGDARITWLGAILRKTKLDELPELWNVVRGDMSLVGPRPEVPRYVDLNNPDWRSALSVRPGVTDPVTMRLRDEEALMARVEGDREGFYLNSLQPLKIRGYLAYLSRRTWLTDVQVLFSTVLVVIAPRRLLPDRSSDLIGDGKD
jgi:lipopolysaccharide/colanic/teichoic acid biosynthesis glycosyltransferase